MKNINIKIKIKVLVGGHKVTIDLKEQELVTFLCKETDQVNRELEKKEKKKKVLETWRTIKNSMDFQRETEKERMNLGKYNLKNNSWNYPKFAKNTKLIDLRNELLKIIQTNIYWNPS